jgi:hypothetical protein
MADPNPLDIIYQQGVTAESVGAKPQTATMDTNDYESVYSSGESQAFPNKVTPVTPPSPYVVNTTVKGSGTTEDPFKVGMEYYANAAKAGGFDLARQWAGVAAMTGVVPYEVLKDDFSSTRMEQFKDPVSAIPPPDLFGIGKTTVQSAPFLANVYAGGAIGGAIGAGVGAAAGVPAAPETGGISVPLLGVSFGVGGSELGAAGTAMTLSAGGAYMSARENGIPHDVAITKALAYGAVAGVLQTLRLKALDQATKAGVSQFAKSEVGKQTIFDTVKKVAINLNFQAGVGAIQEVTNSITSMLAGGFSGVHNNYTNADDWAKRLWDDFTRSYGEGLKGAVGISGAHYAGGAIKGAFTKPKVSTATTDLGKAAEDAVNFLDQPTEEKLKELQQHHDELTKKIAETEKTIEEKAAEIITQREKEIADFNAQGGVNKYVPARISKQEARQMAEQRYADQIKEEADRIQAEGPQVVNKVPAPLNAPQKPAMDETALTQRISKEQGIPMSAARKLAKEQIEKAASHVNKPGELASSLYQHPRQPAISREDAVAKATSRFDSEINKEANAIMDANDAAIKSTAGAAMPPRSITPKQAREMVMEKTTPADLKRQAKEIANQIGLLNGSVEKFDYADVPKTSKENKKAMLTDWEARRAAEEARDAEVVQKAVDALPEATGKPSGKVKRALLGGGKSTMTLSGFADNLSVFAKGKEEKAITDLLDVTPENNNKSKMLTGSVTKAFTEFAESVGSLKRAKDLIDSGKRKAERGTFYNTKGEPQKLGHLTLNQVLDIHLRFKDSDAHAGLHNLGYTRKGETKVGEISTEELVDNILTKVDNGDRKKLGDAILRYWDWKHEGTNEHFIKEYGRELPHVKNYSGQIKYEKQPNDPVEELSYEARLQKMYDRGGDPNSLKEREGNFDRRLKIEDPIDRLFNQTVEVDSWRAMSEKNRQLDRFINNEQVDKRIRHTWGDTYKAMLTSSVEMTTGVRSTPIESRNKFADFLRGNIATGFMGGNDPVQLARQLTGVMNLTSEVPAHKITTGIVRGIAESTKKDGGELGAYLKDSQVYQDRKNHILRDVHQLTGEHALPLHVRNGLMTVKDYGMLATVVGGRTADALGGFSAYNYAKNTLGKSHEQAVLFADSAVEKTQSSMRESEKTFFERGGGFQGLMVALQKQNIQVFHIEKNVLTRAIIQKDKSAIGKAVSVVASYHAAAALYTMISVSPTLLGKDENAKEGAWNKVWFSAGAGAFATTPLLMGDVAYGILASEPQHAPDTVPGRLAANTVSGVRGIVSAAQDSAAKGEFLMDDFLEAGHKMLDASTILTGIPLSTTERTVKRYSPLVTGEQ